MQVTEAQIQERLRLNGFMNHNYIQLELVEDDHAIYTLEIRPESKNPAGMVHGGALYTMADNATGTAAHTDGRAYVTQSSDMHFLRGEYKGLVRCEARVRHRGRTTVLIDTEITNEAGKTLATGTFTYFCVGEKMGDSDAKE